MIVEFDPTDVRSYELFLRVKSLPVFRVRGRTAEFPDEYAARLGLSVAGPETVAYDPIPGLFDYQRDIAALALRRRKFAVFADCGLGKTLIMTEYVRHVLRCLPPDRCALIVSPLMVVDQTLAEVSRWYGAAIPIERVRAADLPRWLASGSCRLGITNYEALTDRVEPGRIGALILDESSLLKSAYGKWGGRCIRLGKGLDWKLALTGTPAPNDRIEFANHAVFLDAFPTINSFLARYFVNRGQTDNRWEMKPHALGPFYRSLSHWSIFLHDPATYGWRDNVRSLPPIRAHVHDVELTEAQLGRLRSATGMMLAHDLGGIVGRTRAARIAKSGDSLKPAFIRALVESWPEESTLVWCRFNEEQDRLAREIPRASSIAGSTPEPERARIIADFRAGRCRVLLTKPKLLGFGLNLQVATRQIFSSLHDSWEEYYQAVKRSNRVGSSKPLDVHIPITEAERPMVETVLRKAGRIDADTREQERVFREMATVTGGIDHA